MNNFYLILAAIGLTFIIKYGFILNSFRNWLKNKAVNFNKIFGEYITELLNCSQCLGFWCGFFVFFIHSFTLSCYNINIIQVILYGFVVSFLANLSDMVLTLLDEIIYKIRNNDGERKFKEN